MLQLTFAQPLQNRALGGLTLMPQRIVHVAALFVLCRQSCRSAKVGLIGEHDKKFRLLTVSRMIHDPRRNLGRNHRLFWRVTLAASSRRAERRQRYYPSCYDEQ